MSEEKIIIHFVDRETLEDLGKIYYLAVELGMPADDVLELVIKEGT